MLDLFRRKRGEWVNKVKALPAAVAAPEADQVEAGNGGGERKMGGKINGKGKGKEAGTEKKKTAIELARERHAAGTPNTAAFRGKKGFRPTGANSVQKVGGK